MSDAAAALPTHHSILGMGSYGCVYDTPLDCVSGLRIEPVRLDKTGLPQDQWVYKVQKASSSAHLLAVNAILSEVDATHAFTVPILNSCNVAKQRLKDCAPLKDYDGPLMQFTMSKGLDSSALTFTNYGIVFEKLTDLFNGITKLGQAGFVHGDIKKANVLFFTSDNRFRLIDYDFVASMHLVPLHSAPVTKTLSGTPDATVFTRESWNAAVSDSKLLDVLQSDPESFLSYAKFAVTCNVYFPPENIVLRMCWSALQRLKNGNYVTVSQADILESLKKQAEEWTDSYFDYFLMRKKPDGKKEFMHERFELVKDMNYFGTAQRKLKKCFTDIVERAGALNDPRIQTTNFYLDMFRQAYYPHLHDAFQVGFFILQFVLQHQAHLQGDTIRRLLIAADALLCTNPAKRKDVWVAATYLLIISNVLKKS